MVENYRVYNNLPSVLQSQYIVCIGTQRQTRQEANDQRINYLSVWVEFSPVRNGGKELGFCYEKKSWQKHLLGGCDSKSAAK